MTTSPLEIPDLDQPPPAELADPDDPAIYEPLPLDTETTPMG